MVTTNISICQETEISVFDKKNIRNGCYYRLSSINNGVYYESKLILPRKKKGIHSCIPETPTNRSIVHNDTILHNKKSPDSRMIYNLNKETMNQNNMITQLRYKLEIIRGVLSSNIQFDKNVHKVK